MDKQQFNANAFNPTCFREGREAFRAHGVAGQTRHSFAAGSIERASFLAGFSEEHYAARLRASDEALAYHQLSVRESAADRAWAERLAAHSA
ncbi:MAG: hypothetical protein EKK53_00820 [Burkholderiales bacterium]|nr:MAG: hypothetical protein EKK53_00820 [Burkholderiales bacterium]